MDGVSPPRSFFQKSIDFVTFPIRALTLFEDDRWGLSSLRSERFEIAARETQGYTLDVGCGKDNLFVTKYLKGHGKGIDIYPYPGLSEEHLVKSFSRFPGHADEYSSVTFIACLNHCPRSQRDSELSEAHRVLRPGGNVIITMGQPVAEVLVHRLVYYYDKFLGTHVDMDSERGMSGEEAYYLTEIEILERLTKAGFVAIRKRYFWTQWFLNRVYTGTKPAAPSVPPDSGGPNPRGNW
jgi:SAM-dependent methyltransferase